jgi:hypothetical protein
MQRAERKTRRIVLRASDAEVSSLDQVCERVGMRRSDLIRRALAREIALLALELDDEGRSDD